MLLSKTNNVIQIRWARNRLPNPELRKVMDVTASIVQRLHSVSDVEFLEYEEVLCRLSRKIRMQLCCFVLQRKQFMADPEIWEKATRLLEQTLDALNCRNAGTNEFRENIRVRLEVLRAIRKSGSVSLELVDAD